ncbi:MAG: 3-hydroxyacyl-CoA dehydrogenase family protein [Desulfobacterales bacterium]|jgi:3-hydroxybutyryl-CoA dehydrogenase|nr:3-hydroxyacyl-CoA dehydrogenase family protein [Desulfobacteraceae bacterium]MBT7085315.1 3-hydroxyacyl-CoA dehydrogenase family protein [Desulfobacterales bacterium]MBT7698231.1 3-hydroxyacyl-CoA dehydrogenase family protein [Desulfobacterales bacterium]
MAEIKKVGIIGAGMMGADIAISCALAGCEVFMKEISMDLAQAGHDRIAKDLKKWVSKGRIKTDDAGVEKALGLLIPTDSFDLFADVDIVIEAIFEDINVKAENYKELDKVCKPSCIIASNTSSISITKLASASFDSIERKANFVGMHFFSPAVIMKLVEVIKGEETSDETMAAASAFCKKISKEPVTVVDCVGFVVNRILYALNNEAIRLYEEGVCSIEDIDKACQLGLGHPVGPFALMDLTDNALNLNVGNILYEAYGDRFLPRPSMKKKVDAGHYGRKSGRGWHDYRK